MARNFTLQYWLDDGWYVGRLKEVPWSSAKAKRWRSWKPMFARLTSSCSKMKNRCLTRNIQIKDIAVEV